jgi:hypothetical protein
MGKRERIDSSRVEGDMMDEGLEGMITLTLVSGDEIYVNPEQIVFIRQPIQGEYPDGAKAVIGIGVTLGVRDTPQSVRALVEGTQTKSLPDPFGEIG